MGVFMMSAAIGRAAKLGCRKKFRVFRKPALQITMTTADGLAFATSYALFRLHMRVPELVFFPGRLLGTHSREIDVFSILAVLFIFVRLLAGDYSRRELFWDNTRTTSKALIVASVPDILITLLGHAVYDVSVVILSWLFLLFAVPLYRQLARAVLRKAGIWSIPAALIGEVDNVTRINSALSSSLSLGFDLRTVLSIPRDAVFSHQAYDNSTMPALQPADLVGRAMSSGCELAVLAAQDVQSEQTSQMARAVLEAGMSLAIVPSLQRLPLSGLSVNQFFGKDVLLLQVRDHSQDFSRRALKRAFDWLGSTVLLIALSPLFAVIAIAIKRYDEGPIFYGHTRIGRNGKPFRCLKFRTMAADADERLARWKEEHPDLYAEFLKTYKLRNDPRVTGPGKWLRRTSLDELPQLFNVLCGEMSLVGPRPVLQRELDEYYGSAASLYKRVRPGMTGLWQISGRSDTTYEERVTYDELYVLNWSFWYDLVILFQTAWFVIRGQGAF